MQNKDVKYNKNLANEVTIWAATPEFQEIRTSEIANGRFFSSEESASGKNVGIIGAVIAERLFDKANPVGKQISIEGKKTLIIGVFKKEGEGGSATMEWMR